VSSLTKDNTFSPKLVLQRLLQTAPILLITMILCSPVYAGLATCAGSYTLGNSNPNDLVPPGGSSAGCEQVDKQFSTFGYTPGGTNPVAGSGVAVNFAGTSPLSAIGVEFGGSNTWNVNSPSASTTAIGTYDVAVDPAFSNSITSMTLSANATFGTPALGTDNITLFEYFCAGGAAACAGGAAATGGINLTSPTAGYLEFIDTGTGFGSGSNQFVCFNNGGSSCTASSNNTINFVTSIYTGGFKDIYIANNVSVSSTSGVQVSLNNFTENYFESLDTPEPSTFALMGVALAGLGLARYRRKV